MARNKSQPHNFSPFYSQINTKNVENMAFVSTAALRIVLAVQMKNRPTAEPNYRPLFYIIICISSKRSDTDMAE